MDDFDFSKFKVLVCDPTQDAIDITRQTYEDVAIGDYFFCQSAQDTLKNVSHLNPDIILVSLKFDDMNGIELIQKIRGLEKGRFYTTPILLMLDRASQNMMREACRAGIEGALRKPLSPDKIIRFSRAVLLKPRRFICVRHYFGPERRMRDDPHYKGENRRQTFSDKDTDLKTYTAPKSNGPRGAVLSSDKPAWAADVNKPSGPKPSGGVIDHGSDDFKTSAHKDGSTDFDLAGGNAASDKKTGDYDLSEGATSSSDSTNGDFDFGFTETKKDFDNTAIDFTSEDKPTKEKADIDVAASENQPDTSSEEIEPTGPEDDDFEEIIDLEECLELHKEWINSGGKRGQQAKRPHSDFRGKELSEADFTAAVLPESNFEDVKCDKVVLRKADLRGSTFKNTLLSGADLRVSRLAQADMRNARMDQANLLGADLSGANLEGATLRGVNLSGANLTRTNLRGVNLASAKGLIPDQVKRAITDSATRLPLGHK